MLSVCMYVLCYVCVCVVYVCMCVSILRQGGERSDGGVCVRHGGLMRPRNSL